MEQQLSVLLYSKYSSHSKQLMDLLRTLPTDLLNLRHICVDNVDVRKKILQSKKIDIKIVPSILNVYPDGGVEKYEGVTAFKLIEELIRQNAPPPQPEPQSEAEVEVEPVRERAPVGRKRSYKKPAPVKNSVVTAIEELDTEEEEEEENEVGHESIKRPPIVIRNETGNYDIGDFGSVEEDEYRGGVSKGIKEMTGNTKSSGNLMATAMAMQKSREQLDSNKNRPLGMPGGRM